MGSANQLRLTLISGPAEVAQLTAGADRLDPNENPFDSFAPTLALGVARMPGRATVDRAAPHGASPPDRAGARRSPACPALIQRFAISALRKQEPRS